MERAVAIPELIEKWSLRLKLGNLSVRFLDEDPEPDTRACNNLWFPKRVGVIRIHKEAPEAVWEECVLHEMLHVALAEWVSDVKDFAGEESFPDVSPCDNSAPRGIRGGRN